MVERGVAVIITGDPVPAAEAARGNYAAMIRAAAGTAWRGPWLEVDARADEPLPEPSGLAGVVVTGSAASVTECAPWMLRLREYLARLVDAGTPTFGVCFGHQLLAQAMGGLVDRNPNGREIGSERFECLMRDPLFVGVDGGGFANQTHVDAVLVPPAGAVVLARTRRDPHAALRVGRAAWGVQFHPEMDAAITSHYVQARRSMIAEEGQDPDAILANLNDGEAGRTVMRNFLALLRNTPRSVA